MITEFKENTKYYLERSKEYISQSVDIALLSPFGYPSKIEDIPKETRDHYGITDSIKLSMLVMSKIELNNGNVAFNVQIRPYSNFLKPSSCVVNFMNNYQFNLAKQMYQTDVFLDKHEYKGLDIKE